MQCAGFRVKRFTLGGGMPETDYMVLDVSVTVTEGDALKVTGHASTSGGGLDPADAAGDFVFGYLVGITDRSGLAIELMKAADYDGTLTTSPSGNTYVATSDNTTDKMITGAYKPAFGVVASALLSAAQGASAGSDGVGNYFDILTTDSRKLDETSVSATKAQYLSLAGRRADDPTDPDDPTTTRIMVQAIQTYVGQTQ